jgi:hypothetical protein
MAGRKIALAFEALHEFLRRKTILPVCYDPSCESD